MNNRDYSLRLRLGSNSVELVTDQIEIWQSLGHIYRAFAAESVPSLPAGLDQLGDGDWRASIGEQVFHFDEFSIAIIELEDIIANHLLPKSDALLLHAAVVCNEHHFVFLIGPSGSGKTTLSLELTRRGMQYVTDEFAIINGDLLQPFPRSAIRKYEGPLPEGRNLMIPDDWGYRSHLLPEHRAGLEPVRMPAWSIVFPTYSPDKRASVRKLSSAEASAELMCSTFGIEGKVEQLWPVLVDFVKVPNVLAFNYSDAKNDLNSVLKLIEEK